MLRQGVVTQAFEEVVVIATAAMTGGYVMVKGHRAMLDVAFPRFQVTVKGYEGYIAP